MNQRPFSLPALAIMLLAAAATGAIANLVADEEKQVPWCGYPDEEEGEDGPEEAI